MQTYRSYIIYSVVFLAGWFAHQTISPLLATSPIKNSQLHENKQNAVIYQAQTDNESETMFIEQVSIIQDRPDQLMLEVSYIYRDPIPASQIKLFAYLGTSFTYIGSTEVIEGTQKRRISIGLIENNMKEKDVQKFETHEITLSFEHYAPDKYMGAKSRTPIPFFKSWTIKN